MDRTVTPADILDRVLQGSARRPLEPAGPLAAGIVSGDPAASMRLLALASQARLFALPPAPAGFDDVAAGTDPRAIVPAAARKPMLRLVTGKGGPADDPAAFALAAALDRLQLRPHPFDLPRLEAFVRKHAERLGPSAAAMLARDRPEGAQAYWLEMAELDASNWALATPARKAAFIAGLRASDPAAARALLEQQLPLEKADVRLRLVEALATGLGDADRPFLEGLLGDRAPNVKQAATRLLARLPGTGAAQAQLGELVSRLTAGSAGLLRKRTVLKLQLPANVRAGPAATQWLAANFGAVGSDQLASALDLDEARLVEAAADDAPLLLGIAFAAATARNFAMLESLAESRLPDLWSLFLDAGFAQFGLAAADERARWAAAVIPAAATARALPYHSLVQLQQAFEGPLPLAEARLLLRAALHSANRSDEMLTAAVALVPLEGMAEARRELVALPPDAAPRAALFAELLAILSEGPTRP